MRGEAGTTRSGGWWLAAVLLLAAGCPGTKDAGTAAPPAASPSAAVTGTVTYRERIMLPPGATLTVRLTDVSKQDAAAMVLAEQVISPVRVPQPYSLSYAPAAIDSTHTYVLQARIEEGKKLRFINMEQFRVLTRGAPADSVEILVKGVP